MFQDTRCDLFMFQKKPEFVFKKSFFHVAHTQSCVFRVISKDFKRAQCASKHNRKGLFKGSKMTAQFYNIFSNFYSNMRVL